MLLERIALNGVLRHQRARASKEIIDAVLGVSACVYEALGVSNGGVAKGRQQGVLRRRGEDETDLHRPREREGVDARKPRAVKTGDGASVEEAGRRVSSWQDVEVAIATPQLAENLVTEEVGAAPVVFVALLVGKRAFYGGVEDNVVGQT